MGLGKTLQTISLLAYLAAYKGIWGPHLVIVPTSVIINWETELKRFCPGFKVLTYYGSAKRRKELRTGWTKSNWYHVVITSYQLAVQDAFAFKRKKWYYLILDEAQNIKNFQSQRWQTLINFNTQRRLLLTGTPLQNSLMELWSLLHFLMPYIFKSRKEFSYWFSNPMNNMIEGGNRNDDVIKRLHGIIRPFVLRRLKKDVETQMPGKFEHIVKCQLSRRQMTLYEEFLSRSSTRKALKKGGNFMGMMTVLMQLRKVCNHPDLFEPRSVITPFILPSIPISVPRCVCEVQKDRDFVDSISANMLQPLWCGSSGLPSIGAALRHNQIESNGLKSLCGEYKPTEILEFNDDGNCPTELQTLITEIYKARNDEQVSRTEFHNIVNRRRCSASVFPYSSQLLNTIETECNIFGRCEPAEIRNRRVIETPSKLLELRKMDTYRAIDMEQTIEKFVFRVPPAGGRAPKLDNGIPKTQGESGFSKDVEAMLLEPLEEVLEPYRKARARLSSFFPDKKLIQYDAGKLQALAPLLRKLKEGAHRCLIFTQMSKVLDVLEAFLSMNGHTYLRLDGSTGVDRRQRYMDRFNNDTKIFCFILSTRSGGMGINLTGADTVIFYDSDWNPAMDAQAQDRAHRIGQTRDVHIYRLITEHSIEENILIKAQKKKNLDILVMDQGQFDASASPPQEDVPTDDIKDVFSKKGLQAILGVSDDEPDTSLAEQEQPPDMSKEQMEKAMASLEDEDDVKALQGAQKEAVEDLKEFDENTAIPKGSDDEEDGRKRSEEGKTTRKKPIKKGNKKEATDTAKPEGEEQQNSDEKELEKEFAAWQSTEGFDEKAIEQSLSPMEKYGLKFREDIDPFYSIFFINEQRRKMEVMEGAEEIDIEEVERKKAMEEYQAIENQDLLGTGIRPEDLVRQRSLYRREKARLRSDKKRRKITGEFWSQKIDGVSNKPFWYNDETGEATWDTPRVVIELRAEELAIQQGWSHLPIDPLFHIMGYLLPFPERQVCGAVCHQWRLASTDARFVIHVYPVEMISLASREPNKRHYNHHASIEDALAIALPGDIIGKFFSALIVCSFIRSRNSLEY
jgi:SNF2 family DNA or RNA helicase